MEANKPSLFRIIVPAFPGINVFTRQAKATTALGPIMVAAAANKSLGLGWRVEVVDENNYRGPRDNDMLPDHAVLQKSDPAKIVGFYCGLTSTIERVWDLAKFYKEQGVSVIAGGWHAHYRPEETLEHNIDVVVHGDAELIIGQLVESLARKESLENVSGISFRQDREVKRNAPFMLKNENLDSFPYPDFGLLRFAKVRIYPIGRIRGCGENCEFCSVKGKPRYASGKHLYDTVRWLVETRGARRFFIVDDRLEQDLRGTIDFFQRIYNKYGNRLCFTVQIRLGVVKNVALLDAMKKAGVRHVCVGFESPIDEDLKAMRKGYLSLHMIEWTKVLRRYFWIHGMFIAAYPLKGQQSSLRPEEIVRRFRRFIRRARLDSIQVLLPVPLVGTDLRKRLGERVFPLNLVPWRMYDGTYLCFRPDSMSVEESQWIGIKLMGSFYRRISLVRIGIRTIIFPLDFLIRGWSKWHHSWRRDIVNYYGYLLVRKRLRKKRDRDFIGILEQ